jgi:hypothetical protein
MLKYPKADQHLAKEVHSIKAMERFRGTAGAKSKRAPKSEISNSR